MANQVDLHEIRGAEQIVADIKALIASEVSQPDNEVADLDALQTALDAMNTFMSGTPEMLDTAAPATAVAPVVDTGLLTGPIGGLKNYLLKKSQRND